MKFDKSTINYKHFLLGVLLNILVIIVFLLIYHAYIISPRLKTGAETTGVGAKASGMLNESVEVINQ